MMHLRSPAPNGPAMPPSRPPASHHTGFRAIAVALLLLPIAGAQGQEVAPALDPAALAARQVERGEQWFRSACLQCHALGAVSNPDFRLKWGGRTAQDLFDLISRTMPDGDPGSLSRGAYLAITAYLLKLNGMPVAAAPLAADSTTLGGIRLAFPSTPR